MTWQSLVFEGAAIAICWPTVWTLMHLAEDVRPLLPDEEIGFVCGAVLVCLLHARRAYITQKPA